MVVLVVCFSFVFSFFVHRFFFCQWLSIGFSTVFLLGCSTVWLFVVGCFLFNMCCLQVL